MTATIFAFIAAWNEYVVALTRMQDDGKPLTVGLNSFVTGYEQQWNSLFAASIVAIVPVVILFAHGVFRIRSRLCPPGPVSWSRSAPDLRDARRLDQSSFSEHILRGLNISRRFHSIASTQRIAMRMSPTPSGEGFRQTTARDRDETYESSEG